MLCFTCFDQSGSKEELLVNHLLGTIIRCTAGLLFQFSGPTKPNKPIKNGPSPASFIVYFWSFQTNITIFTTIYEKMSIQSPDSNPRPLGRECPPITTRPGLPGVLSYHDCHGRTDVLFHCILDWIGSNVAASES